MNALHCPGVEEPTPEIAKKKKLTPKSIGKFLLAGASIAGAYEVAYLVDTHSLLHAESVVERDISEELEQQISVYRPGASIKTHCREGKIIPGVSEVAKFVSIGNNEEVNGHVYGGFQTINLKPRVCEGVKEGAGRNLEIRLAVDEGRSMIGITFDDESPKTGVVVGESTNYFMSSEAFSFLRSYSTIAHETAHSSFDIVDEACSDVVGDYLTELKFLELLDNDMSNEILKTQILGGMLETIDNKKPAQYANELCEESLGSLLEQS